jgi:hypothetical protein
MGRLLPLLLLALLGCSVAAPTPSPTTAPVAPSASKGLAGGVKYLVAHQSEDGSWRSDVYATFKDGTALTPLVLCSLLDAGGDESREARKKAAAWLAKKAKPDGTIDEGPDGLPYPVYTAACGVIALSHEENQEHVKARDAWLKYLLVRQLTEANGWSPEDPQFGGWGYYPGIPKKPNPGQAVPAQHLLETNLSATTFALEAIVAAKAFKAGPHPVLIEQFVLPRLQNADGGFRLVADDPVRNKAGLELGPDGKPVFRSYGSATADGARAEYLCLIIDGARSAEARAKLPNPPPGRSLPADGGRSVDWLEKQFRADIHPGDYIATHERNRNAVYFYYAMSAAKLFRMYYRGVYAKDLSDALLAKQKPDGSWENPLDQQRENDPLLATAYAVSALAVCDAARKK